jgi:heme oxygenase
MTAPAADAAPFPGRAALRAATAAAHERLHHLPPFAALATGKLGRPAYAALLRRLLGFHLALEAAVAAAPPLARFGLDAAERCRTHLIRLDLEALGVPPRPGLPAPAIAPFATAAAALGGLYVSEGATLGGKVLAYSLEGMLGPGVAGRSFLLGHGAAHGAMWRSFCIALERCAAEPGALAAMAGGAEATFSVFETWFAAPGWMPAEPPPG